MRNLKELRVEIDKIDAKLVKILEERFELVREVGAYKKANNLPVLDLEREKLVLASKKELLTNPKEFDQYQRIFQLIMDIAKEMEL